MKKVLLATVIGALLLATPAEARPVHHVKVVKCKYGKKQVRSSHACARKRMALKRARWIWSHEGAGLDLPVLPAPPNAA